MRKASTRTSWDSDVAIVDVSHGLLVELVAELGGLLDGKRRPAGVVLAGDFSSCGSPDVGFELEAPGAEATRSLFECVQSAKAVLRRLETEVPIVVASEGSALDVGLELAMRGWYRIAADGPYEVGFPHMSVGLPPGFGGLTRLTRIVGVEAAVTTVLAGVRPVNEAPAAGLFDEVLPAGGDVLSAGLKRLRELIGVSRHAGWDTPGYRIPGGANAHGAVASMPTRLRKALGGEPVAVAQNVMCAAVEGAMVDIDTADRVETRYYVASATSADHRRLRRLMRSARHLGIASATPSGDVGWPPLFDLPRGHRLGVDLLPRLQRALDEAVVAELDRGTSTDLITRALSMLGIRHRPTVLDNVPSSSGALPGETDRSGVEHRLLESLAALADEFGDAEPDEVDIASVAAGVFPARLGGLASFVREREPGREGKAR